MGGKSLPSLPLKKFVKLYEEFGSIQAVARESGKSYSGVHAAYDEAVAEGLMDPVRQGRKTNEHIVKAIKGTLRAKKNDEPVIEGKLRAREGVVLPINRKGITRFLFSSVQNNTVLFEKFWDNLLILRQHYDAQLHVSRFAYIKAGLGSRGDKRSWLNNEPYESSKKLWWDARTAPYWMDDRAEVAPGLVFCGELNILPTKVHPLSGYEVYTGRKSGIFPHVKLAMESIATVNTEEPTKFNYTTGTVTMRNYIQRDAGLKAEFHHCYGALLVEVNEDGDWWCRQINADSEGTIYDKDICVKNRKLTTGNRVEAINSGDAHVSEMDESVFEATWGEGGMLDTLHAKYQFMNDILNFDSKNHHNIKNPHKQFLLHVKKRNSVSAEILGMIDFLKKATRPWCKTEIVDSNHDRALARWLAEQSGIHDPKNAQFWLNLQQATFDYMERNHEEPNHLQLAVRMFDKTLEKKHRVHFIPQDGSFVICHDRSGGIECALHGDRGPNGARGSAAGIAKMGRKANIGHSHSAAIKDGVYQAGTSSLLKLDYNHGPSSWSHTHIVTYANGKRALYTIWRGKWCA